MVLDCVGGKGALNYADAGASLRLLPVMDRQLGLLLLGLLLRLLDRGCIHWGERWSGEEDVHFNGTGS